MLRRLSTKAVTATIGAAAAVVNVGTNSVQTISESTFSAFSSSTSSSSASNYDDSDDDDGDSEDDAGYPTMEGLLQRKAWEDGSWIDMYGILRHELFLLYKTKGIELSTELMETIDVRKIKEIISLDGVMQVILAEGLPHIFRGATMDPWRSVLLTAREVFATNSIAMAGWVVRKSQKKRLGQKVSKYFSSSMYIYIFIYIFIYSFIHSFVPFLSTSTSTSTSTRFK